MFGRKTALPAWDRIGRQELLNKPRCAFAVSSVEVQLRIKPDVKSIIVRHVELDNIVEKNADNWLDRWLEKITIAANGKAILELGCGEGRDTQQLSQAGLCVVGMDKSKEAIGIASKCNPDCTFGIGDLRSDLPDTENAYPVVLASLCLHYFSLTETLHIVQKIHDILPENGLLLVRVNSTEDTNYGSKGYPELETNYFQVKGNAKRFFNEDALDSVFTGEDWNTLSREKNTIHRYEKPKIVWELVLVKR